jgi:hypothetical protein
MGWQILGADGVTVLKVDATPGAARALLYDSSGNVMVPADKTAAPAGQGYLPNAGLDGGKMLRAIRVGEYGTLRTTSDVVLFQDAFEGANLNAGWTQSLATMTAVQLTSVLTLNNSNITTLNTDAIITSARQFQKYPKQPLWARFRANITANAAANHTLVELGFGAPTTTTAIVSNGCFFRWAADGSLKAVISYNGTEQVTQVLAQGAISTTSYYWYDIVVDDDFARFMVVDANGVPVVDQQIPLTLTVPYIWAVSHLPTFARVYVDGTGGGTAVQLKISGHSVDAMDAAMNKPWAEQMSSSARSWAQNPLTQAQTAALSSAAPGGGTPSNTATVYTTLGGEYIATMTAASENMLSLFGFVVPAPYTLYIRGIYWVVPWVSTVFSIASTQPFILPFLIANASSANISTATGKIGVPFGTMWTAAITSAVGTVLTGNPVTWTPQNPIACLPGTTLHLGWKVLNGGAVTTGAIRGSVLVDGYFE